MLLTIFKLKYSRYPKCLIPFFAISVCEFKAGITHSNNVKIVVAVQ